MNLRATCVESTRSAGAWKVPTLSAREWRSATDPALGAHGSCTCTKSSGALLSASSIVRAMSTGGEGLMPLRLALNSSSPTPSTRTSPSGAKIDSGLLTSGPDQPPGLAHELRRARRGEQQHPVAPLGQLTRDLPREGPDLVRILERMRCDLRDGEAVTHVAPA